MVLLKIMFASGPDSGSSHGAEQSRISVRTLRGQSKGMMRSIQEIYEEGLDFHSLLSVTAEVMSAKRATSGGDPEAADCFGYFALALSSFDAGPSPTEFT